MGMAKFWNLSITSEKAINSPDFGLLLKQMKSNSTNWSTDQPSYKDINYVFVQHKVEDKSIKEQEIAKFLNEEGIFQINLKIALEDYFRF